MPDHLVARAADADYRLPTLYEGHSRGFTRWTVVGAGTAAVHTGFAVCELEPGGSVDRHVHSYEESFHVLSGELVCETDGGPVTAAPGDYGVITVGTPHTWRNAGDEPARWARMAAPQPRDEPDTDTFFVAPPDGDRPAGAPAAVDARDPRTRWFGHIEPVNMDPDRQSQEHLAQSASMRTALLVYSGITVKMMVDSDLGAQLSTMFMVQYDPGGVAGAHDHPLEETYLILDGEVDATFDGRTHRLVAGDVAWAGVGCVHEFANPQPDATVRWLETQAPQPPRRHSYRFERDWSYLRGVLE